MSGDDGALVVQAAVVPPLGSRDRLEVLLDGTPVASESHELAYRVYGTAPGLHVLQARIIDASGNVGAISATHVFTVRDSRTVPAREALDDDPILDARWGP